MIQVGDMVLDKYHILRLLGKGGMGSVFLAENINVGNLWAIKEIPTPPGHSVGLTFEPEILKKINHPLMPRIVDVVRGKDSLIIVEDYFEGQNLQKVAENRHICSEGNVVKWARQLAEILLYLHNLKPMPIIYSDLKPSNIIIDQNLDLKLIDFGIARETSGYSSQGVFGSRGFAAPEQYQGIYNERTDIYSFGALFYYVLTGTRYDTKKPVRLLAVNPNLSQGIDHIAHKCLQLNPRLRYNNAAELSADLQHINQYNSDYKKRILKKRIAVGGTIAIIAVGLLTVNLGLAKIEATSQALYQERIDSGVSLTEEGRYLEAEASFTEALNYQKSPTVYQYLARLYLRENRPAAAIEFLNGRLINGDLQNSAATSYLMGSAYFDLKNYEKAITQYQQALQRPREELKRDYEPARRDLAVSYSRIGKYQEAELVLAEIEKDYGKGGAATNYIRGEIHLAQKNYGDAWTYMKKALDIEPQNTQYSLGLGQVLSQWSAESSSSTDKLRNMAEAQQIMRAAVSSDPYNIQVLSDYGRYSYELGGLYESTDDSRQQTAFQDAKVAFTKLKDIGIEDSNTYLNLAMVSDKLGDNSTAETYFMQSLRLDAGNSHANFIYALFKLKNEKYDSAYQYLQKTVDLNKNSYEVSAAQARIKELKQKGWI